MKITHLCLNGPVTDGWNYQDNLLTKYQHLNGHDVTIITSKWVWNDKGKLVYGDFADPCYFNKDGVKTIRIELRGINKFSKKFKRYKNLKKTIETTNPDILFIHGVNSLDNNVIVDYLKKHPTVIAYADNHADLTNSGTNWFSKRILHGLIWRYYSSKLVPFVRRFYGVLPIRVDFLTDIYKIPKEKCDLLVMGGDDDAIAEALKPDTKKNIRKRLNVNDSDFLIMTGGKIDAWKAQTMLLMEAIKKMGDAEIKLVVFGSVADEIKEKFNSLCDLNKIRYIGWVDPRESNFYFAAADLVVFPGRHSVFWEQVAAEGIPMIVKELPGTNHIDCGGNCLFLREDSVDEIVETITIARKNYDEMKKIAVEVGMNKFSYRQIAKKAISEC